MDLMTFLSDPNNQFFAGFMLIIMFIGIYAIVRAMRK